MLQEKNRIQQCHMFLDLNRKFQVMKKQIVNQFIYFMIKKAFLFFFHTAVVTDEPIRMKNLTAGDEPSSQILYIRGLTRPFTLLQLKSLLSRYGALVDGQFWLNKIKSECLATVNNVFDV